ncbi:hypothetical protein HYT26_03630 [Candidatus Pacearchaeota archaeon]|nr:hypothetical protein [Candidatus Pacearchaeota archaeon]
MSDTHKRIHNSEEMYKKNVIVVPKPVVALPGDCLAKVYDMFYKGESMDTSSWATYLARAVENRVGNTGLAFLINSNGMMNLSCWDQYVSPADGHTNITLKNRIFTFDEKDIEGSFKEGDIRAEGAYCQHELAIVNHERKAMINYAKSIILNKHSLTNWLDDVYIGEIPY